MADNNERIKINAEETPPEKKENGAAPEKTGEADGMEAAEKNGSESAKASSPAEAKDGKERSPAPQTEEEKEREREKLIQRNVRRLRFFTSALVALVFAVGGLIAVTSISAENEKLGFLQKALGFILSLPLAFLGVHVGRLVKDWRVEEMKENDLLHFNFKLLFNIVWPYAAFFILAASLALLPYLIIAKR
ncbi:MAG: hypothetical protein LBR53_10395 [Deltaproteobacteria bacterium]|nr:hypothetical protein [Deltaproteobacteria bacterium]